MPIPIQPPNISSLSVCSRGHEICKSAHSFGPAVRDHYLIHYIVSGKGEFHCESKAFSLSAGDGFLITPYTSTYYCADIADPWDYYWIGFTGTDASELMRSCGLSRDNPVFHYSIEPPLESYIKPILGVSDKSKAFELSLLGHLYMFLSGIMANKELSGSSDYASSDYEMHIKRAIQFINENYYREFTVEQLADFTGVNRSHLYRIFKSTMGLSVQQYILEFRLEKARNLVCNTALPFNEVAASCGFSDQSHFSRTFKAYYGESPMNYKKKKGSQNENTCN